MTERVHRATTPTKWDAAWSLAKERFALPTSIPLDFFRQIVSGVAPIQGLVRVGFRCNQARARSSFPVVSRRSMRSFSGTSVGREGSASGR